MGTVVKERPFVFPCGLPVVYETHLRIPEFLDEDGRSSLSTEEIIRRMGNSKCFLLNAFERNGSQIMGESMGYLIAYDKYQDGSIYCWMAGVVPDHRKKGVLTTLMNELTQLAKDDGYIAIRIKTRENRRAMRAFLEKYGFEVGEFELHPSGVARIPAIKYI